MLILPHNKYIYIKITNLTLCIVVKLHCIWSNGNKAKTKLIDLQSADVANMTVSSTDSRKHACICISIYLLIHTLILSNC